MVIETLSENNDFTIMEISTVNGYNVGDYITTEENITRASSKDEIRRFLEILELYFIEYKNNMEREQYER
jgi:hypothetical protein